MKINSIALKFTDVDNDVAKLEVVIDPPITLEEMESQPCLDLANQLIEHLQQAKVVANGAGTPNGGPGTDSKTLH